MYAIRRKIYAYAALTAYVLMLSTLFILLEIRHSFNMYFVIGFLLISNTVLAGLWVIIYRKHKAARLIKENTILVICSCIFSSFSQESAKPDDIKNEEILISYFGILFTNNIIRFNQNGILLKAVEIGPDYLSFTYGKERLIKNIKLLRPQISKEKLDELVNKIRFEMGIDAKLIN